MIAKDSQKSSPEKVLQRATFYTTNLRHFHDLPKAMSKSMVVKEAAEDMRNEVDFSIKRSTFQLQLYRRKQNDDFMRRTSYDRKLIASNERVVNNQRGLKQKKASQAERYEKHLHQTYQKYEDEQRKLRANEKEQAYKLRKELQQFYQKQAVRKTEAQAKQIAVTTCYQDAVDRINAIHKSNEQYSIQAQAALEAQMSKNNHLQEALTKKQRAVSSMNAEKPKVYEDSLAILQAREQKHIQKYGHNEDSSILANRHIIEEEEKTRKRIGEFFKKRVDHWMNEKKRVDQAKSEIPKKCTSILERTNNSFFRQTVSSFRNTAKQWSERVSMNKSAIKQEDQAKKDQIMQAHLDLRLLHDSSHKIGERMTSLRGQARKLAGSFL